MANTLPERPDLGQLKQQAKELLRDVQAGRPDALSRLAHPTKRASFALHDAQRTIAREYGFPSWPKLKLHVETRSEDLAEEALIQAALRGNESDTRALLKERPQLFRRSIYAAASLGEAEAVAAWLEKNSDLAVRQGGPHSWPPLLYLCFGQCGSGDASRTTAARLLFEAGADPNASWTDPSWPESPQPGLYGATGVNNFPELARCLLEAGADPDDCESRYHAAENNHVACLEVLKEFGADLSGRDSVWGNTPLYFLFGYLRPGPDVRSGIRWLLENGADPNVKSYLETRDETPLHAAVRNGWENDILALLLKHGADPSARRLDGRTPYALAIRSGREESSRLLLEWGAQADEASSLDRFLGACMRGDEPEAKSALVRERNLMSQLAPEDSHLLHEAAREGRSDALTLMAQLGFDLTVTDTDNGATALHWACFEGMAEAVEVLVRNGAPLDLHDKRFHSPPIGWAAHGSIHCQNPDGDYPTCVRSLIAGGAVVSPGTHGSPEVMAVIRQHLANQQGEEET